MAKKVFDVTAMRFVLEGETVKRLVSSRVNYTETSDGTYSGHRPDGEWNYRNNITKRDDGIAVIHVDGLLGYRVPQSWYPAGDFYDGIQAAFDECLNDASVLGVVLDINSPGGVVNGCCDLADRIFKARGSKPFGIVARTGGSMQSGAYWIGSACEKVYASPAGLIGSIGTVMSFARSDEKNFVTISSNYSPDKAPNPETEQGKNVLQRELDATAKVFIDCVARNRGRTPDYVIQNFGKGANFVGQAAVDVGMIDKVASFEEMCTEMKSFTSNINNEEIMPNPTNAASAAAAPKTAAPVLNEAEIKAQGIAEYKARASAVRGIFAGLPMEEKNIQELIDGEKSIEQITAQALGMAKEQIKAASEKPAATASAATQGPTAGLSPEQVAAVKAGLEAQASAQNGIQGGVSNHEGSNFKELEALCAEVQKSYYK